MGAYYRSPLGVYTLPSVPSNQAMYYLQEPPSGSWKLRKVDLVNGTHEWSVILSAISNPRLCWVPNGVWVTGAHASGDNVYRYDADGNVVASNRITESGYWDHPHITGDQNSRVYALTSHNYSGSDWRIVMVELDEDAVELGRGYSTADPKWGSWKLPTRSVQAFRQAWTQTNDDPHVGGKGITATGGYAARFDASTLEPYLFDEKQHYHIPGALFQNNAWNAGFQLIPSAVFIGFNGPSTGGNNSNQVWLWNSYGASHPLNPPIRQSWDIDAVNSANEARQSGIACATSGDVIMPVSLSDSSAQAEKLIRFTPDFGAGPSETLQWERTVPDLMEESSASDSWGWKGALNLRDGTMVVIGKRFLQGNWFIARFNASDPQPENRQWAIWDTDPTYIIRELRDAVLDIGGNGIDVATW